MYTLDYMIKTDKWWAIVVGINKYLLPPTPFLNGKWSIQKIDHSFEWI